MHCVETKERDSAPVDLPRRGAIQAFDYFIRYDLRPEGPEGNSHDR